jgi:Uma2 family endonuclease
MATVILDEISLQHESIAVQNQLAPALNSDWSLDDLQIHLGGISFQRIRLDPGPGRATELDLLKLLDRKACLAELIDGVLVEKILGQLESRLAMLIGHFILQFITPRKLGLVYGADCPIRLFPNQIRMPDVTFISWSCVPNSQLPVGQVLAIAPELAVEVISPSNTKDEMDRKVKDYFRAGTRLVWYVYPETQSIRVFRSPTEFDDLTAERILNGGDVLPGFELSVQALFDQAMGR